MSDGDHHIGERYHNRTIIDAYPSMYIRRDGTIRKSTVYRWKCNTCGAIGTIRRLDSLKLHPHLCGARVKPREWWLTNSMCAKCGHSADTGSGQGHYCCCYLLDTGKRRPVVDLAKEPCPVFDPSFRRERKDVYYGY